jgi:GNAT superfamily N-acetyltransferase
MTVVSEVFDPNVLQLIYRLRIEAWRTHVIISPDIIEWHEPIDDFARHWAVFVGMELAAAARLSHHEQIQDLPDAEVYAGLLPEKPVPIAAFSRCVVHPHYRGNGFASTLDGVRRKALQYSRCRRAVVTIDHEGRRREIESIGFKKLCSGNQNATGSILAGTSNTIFCMDL